MNYYIKKAILFPMNCFYSLFPKKEIELMFFIKQRYRLNLIEPRTYNEKINWVKLNYNNPLLSVCSDKYLVRQYVKDKGCESTLNELIWDGTRADDIPFDTLPNAFVIKVTHGSGFNIICTNKDGLDIGDAKKKIDKWLRQKYIKCYGEKWYGVERPRIIVEKYLFDNSADGLFDYKFFCFDGEPKYVYVDTWKNKAHHINMYDIDFKLLSNVSLGYPRDTKEVKKPDCYNEMINVARKLSSGFPHVRIDLYDVNGHVIFGEMTFSKGAGFDRILPYEFDLEMGSHFILPNKKQ